LNNAADKAELGGEAFAFINIARFAVPFRIGLAISTAPWVEKNVVEKFGLGGAKDESVNICYETTVQNMIDKNKVMVFSKDYCPYCKKAKDLLSEMDIQYEVVELDLIPDGDKMQDALKVISNQRTVPCIYINKEKLGGCDDLFEAATSQKLNDGTKLDAMLKDAGVTFTPKA
jgi:glutaredoxin 3